MDKNQISQAIRMNGRNPKEVMFTTTASFETGPSCGGWGHVVVRMTAEEKT